MRGLKKMIGGKILKTGRKLRFTQTEVAEVYGVDQSTYRRWESGTHAVGYDDLETICDLVFKMPSEELKRMVLNA